MSLDGAAIDYGLNVGLQQPILAADYFASCNSRQPQRYATFTRFLGLIFQVLKACGQGLKGNQSFKNA